MTGIFIPLRDEYPSVSGWIERGDVSLRLLPVQSANVRQGRYLRTTSEVWWCEDKVCDCRQVVVERVYEHVLCPGLLWRVRIAEGPFCAEGKMPEPEDMGAAAALAASDKEAP